MKSGKDFWSRYFTVLGIAAAVSFWILESVLDAFVAGESNFWTALLHPVKHEIWMRLVVAVFSVVSGFAIQRVAKARELVEKELRKEIEKRVSIETELRRNLEATKKFALRMAHDLRNPMTALSGFAEKLEKNLKKGVDPKNDEWIEIIRRTISRVVSITEDTIDFALVRERPLFIEKISLDDICQVLRDDFSARMEIRDIKFLQPLDSESVFRADKSWICRAFTNIVDNFLKHGGEELKEIEIRYEDRKSFHLFSFRNDGKNIESDQIERIFEPFERGADAKSKFGLGLGLSIVKETAERHGGEVWAESGEDRGVTFFFTIPKGL